MAPKIHIPLALLLTSLIPPSHAATLTWDGGGADNNWNTAANWSTDVAPAPPSDTLTFTGTTQTSTNNNFAANATFTGINFDNTSTGGAFTLSGNQITLGGNIQTSGTTGTPTQTVALDIILNGNRTFGSTANNALTVSGNISETGGSRSLTLSPSSAAAVIKITGNNTFTGSVNLTGGIIQVNTLANGGNSSSLGAGSGSLKLGSNGTQGALEYTGTLAQGHTTDRAIELVGTTGGGKIIASGVGPVTFNAAAVLFANGSAAKTLTLAGNNTAENTIASAIGNEGAFATQLKKDDAGTWVLSGANTYSGNTTLNAGRLVLSGVTNSNSAPITVNSATGQLEVRYLANGGLNSSVGNSSNAAANLVLQGTFNHIGSAASTTDRLFTISGAAGTGLNLQNNGAGVLKFTNTGAIVFNTANTTKFLNFAGNNTGDNTFALAIANNGSGALTLTKNGTGRWILTGSNSYTQTTTVNAGTLQFGSPTALYNGNSTSWTAGNLRVLSGATLAFNVGGSGFSTANVTTLLTNLAASTGVGTNGMNAGSVLGFDTTNAGGSFTISNAIANTTGAAGGARGLTKLGTGTLILSGANTYNGSTTITDGTLLINGSTSSSSVVNVSSGSTLGGSGTVGGATTILSGGTLSPGNSPGVLTFSSSLTLTGTYKWELGALSTSNPGTDFDVITVTAGNVDITGASMNLTLGGFAPSADIFWTSNRTWTGILNNTGAGTLTGAFAEIDNTSWASLGSFSNTYTGNDVNLVWTAVPEPSTWAFLAFSLTTVMLFRRRRQNRHVANTFQTSRRPGV